jgi:hypothetical protein
MALANSFSKVIVSRIVLEMPLTPQKESSVFLTRWYRFLCQIILVQYNASCTLIALLFVVF